MPNITIDTSAINKVVKELGKFEKQMPGAATSAINRTLNHVYTRLGRAITAEYNMKKADVDAKMKKHHAGGGKLSAYIRIKSSRLTLFRFAKGTKRGVSVKVKKSQGSQKMSGKPGSFINAITKKRKDGSEYSTSQVMRRRGKGRYPVDVLFTLSIPQMAENTVVTEKVQTEASKMLNKRIEHEIQFRLKKLGR